MANAKDSGNKRISPLPVYFAVLVVAVLLVSLPSAMTSDSSIPGGISVPSADSIDRPGLSGIRSDLARIDRGCAIHLAGMWTSQPGSKISLHISASPADHDSITEYRSSITGLVMPPWKNEDFLAFDSGPPS